MGKRKVIPLPDVAKIEEASAIWLMRLDDGGISDEDLVEFRRWYNENAQHKSAFDRLAVCWKGMDSLSELTDLGASDDVVHALHTNRRFIATIASKTTVVWGVAASLLVVLAFALSSFLQPRYTGFDAQYQTAIGEQETVGLPDGSTVILNTGSLINVRYTQVARSIEMIRGEAFFEVESDRARPFSVRTKKGEVVAVGTAFSVRILDDKIDVVVTHGSVSLTPAQTKRQMSDPKLPPPPGSMMVNAGQAAAFSQRVESLNQIGEDAIKQRLDWRDGIIAFRGEPLEQVIEDVSRYTDLAIEIEGADLRQQPIGGYFKVGETEALFDALTIMADVQIERIDDKRVRIVSLPK